ncbi:hypothetical protein EDB92DRAFT_2847 [Lactarius akahatsu]|uniref:Uncharacterized protein n=1 Tax=Lactarius akahatsu TaxID=416441 RepID=A0AAD4QHV0_9AGAM|nr:hypothetical protein EDB92DRAFT_2847 [Lactarius akahatsu]
MEVVPFDELNALGKILGLNAERLRNNYNLWGPSARVCISLTKNPDDVGSHAQSVADAANSLTSQYGDFKSTSTRKLFVVRPTSSSRRMATVEFGTNHLRGIVARAYARHDHATRVTFYKAISRLSLFSSPAGQMYEINVFLWFRHARNTDFLRCTSSTTGLPLAIPACPGNLRFLSKLNELHEMYERGRPICWVPISGTLPTLDAVVLTYDSLITVQITIASKHSANNLAFEDVYRNLPRRLKTKPWCHVFISDSDYNAKSLREQDLTIPEGTHIYSAVVDVEKLDSEIVTEDRVEALEKESKYVRTITALAICDSVFENVHSFCFCWTHSGLLISYGLRDKSPPHCHTFRRSGSPASVEPTLLHTRCTS